MNSDLIALVLCVALLFGLTVLDFRWARRINRYHIDLGPNPTWRWYPLRASYAPEGHALHRLLWVNAVARAVAGIACFVFATRLFLGP